jgi:hypothetical protein
MYYRDMTRAAPSAALTVDLSMADGAALDALTVYLMSSEHIRERTTCSAHDTQGETEGTDSAPTASRGGQRLTCPRA